MTSRKPFLALAVLAALSTASAFAATPPAAGDAPRPAKLDTNGDGAVSYTHLTLPTICSV